MIGGCDGEIGIARGGMDECQIVMRKREIRAEVEGLRELGNGLVISPRSQSALPIAQ